MGFFDLGLSNIIDAGTELLNTGLSYANRDWQANREDTAVRRRVADLQAAGLSPVLAAGSAASSSPMPINPIDFDATGKAQIAKAMLAQDADISRTAADTERIKAEAVPAKFMSGVFEKLSSMLTGDGKSFKDALALKMGEGLLAEQDAKIGNAQSALTNARRLNRAFEFDVNNSLYGDIGRNVTELKTLIEHGDSGQLIGILLQALGKVR